MWRFKKTVATFVVGLFFTVIAAGQALAQSIKAGDVNGRLAAAADPKDKGKPAPLPCDSKNNPKCEPESPSKPPDEEGIRGLKSN